MDSTSTEPARSPRKKRKLLLLILGTLMFTACLFEGTLRLLVYTDVSWGKRWRIPELYSDRWSDPFYFQLLKQFTNEPGTLPDRLFDPRLGWVNDEMNPAGFVDPHEDVLGARRPVLLFGDSYIRCMTDEANCFEGWMHRSPYRETHKVFNYGVRAYGIDQIATLTMLALQHWRDRKPIVAIGIYMEEDLDRAYLDYRGWPKPYYTLGEKGQLLSSGPPPTTQKYEHDHPMWQHSLAWGWVLHGMHWLPTGITRWLGGADKIEEQKKRLSAAILLRLEQSLQAMGVEHFYVLFPGIQECADLKPSDWQENFLIDWLDGHELPYVNIKRDLLRASLEESRHPAEYFGLYGPLSEHLTPDGNEIAFRGLLRGIDHDFDRANGRQPPHPADIRDLDGKQSGRVRFEFGWSERFPAAEDRERIFMVPTLEHPARIGCAFSRPARRFKANARLLAREGAELTGSIRVQVRVDRKLVKELVLDANTTTAKLEIDVLGGMNIAIYAAPEGAAEGKTAILMLSSPRFE